MTKHNYPNTSALHAGRLSNTIYIKKTKNK